MTHSETKVSETNRHRPQSAALFARAQQLFPGGVNSPVRAFGGVGGSPVFFERGDGAYLTDVDGHRYIDYVGSFGPLILGHSPRVVREALAAQVALGTSYGAPHPGEIALAEAVQQAMPWIESMRFTNSGSEATTASLRLARGATGRDEVVKFDGCYHGAVDSFLVKAGSGVETLGLPDSPGVPKALAALTHTVDYNDLPQLQALLDRRREHIACVILEPVVGNMGVIVPKPGFLAGVKAACARAGVLLIVDEVMTGFRLARGGAQDLLGVRGDITAFGKVIGGGLPVGAVGASRALMAHLAPAGKIYQAGTLSGNPLAMAAGVATLGALAQPGVYAQLEEAGRALEAGLRGACAAAKVPVQLNRVGSMWTLFFTQAEVLDAKSARTADRAIYGRFFHGMLDRGVYLPPSQFEAAFLSLAHGPVEVEATVRAATETLAALG